MIVEGSRVRIVATTEMGDENYQLNSQDISAGFETGKECTVAKVGDQYIYVDRGPDHSDWAFFPDQLEEVK